LKQSPYDVVFQMPLALGDDDERALRAGDTEKFFESLGVRGFQGA
jgi:hypothetical protein